MPKKILVVDDEQDLEHLVRQKFRQRIRSNELEFLFARNGVDALEKLATNNDVDIVLTDINMPEMDGLTLLLHLQELETLVKPVIISAYGDMENIRIAMNRGAYDFLTKPIDLKDLETTLNKTINDVQILKEALNTRDKFVAIKQELTIARDIQTSSLP
jgi:YesN/AraC family two-component response regulator